MDGGPQLHGALDQVRARNPGDQVVVVDNAGRGPVVIDTRGGPPGGWVLEGVLPTGVVAALSDLDDPSPRTLLENGFDAVLLFGDRGDRAIRFGKKIVLSVHWRPGLAGEVGCDPPAPFYVRFDAARPGFVRVDGPEAP